MTNDILAIRFGLTPAETQLVLRLLDGESLKTIAAARGVSYETIRTTLKHVFEKTGTHRQSELVILMIRLVQEEKKDAV